MNKAVIAAFAAASMLSGGGAALASSVVYQAPATSLGGLCPTCAGTATTLGDDISLAGGPAKLTRMTWDTSNFGADYTAQIQVQLFEVDTSGPVPALGTLFHTQVSDHFLTGGNGVSSRTFVDIALGAGGVFAPERLIYTIKVLNNNGSTNWNMAGQFANNAQDEDETLAQAQIGANNEFDFFFGDWVSTFGADVNTLVTQRLSMDSFQLGLPQNQAFADFSNVTPNVTFTAAVPIPAALPLLATALGALGFAARRRRAAA